ncbi:hypothetical protein Q4508_19745 [Amphritea sp. 2_MG-2023]|uniref:hypothetical protein n=1 Tax=Amphritea TaxID=515417 RepID=UPI001C066FC6|nr:MULTISPECIES: hypothetical protein [Amphritea]MBU2966949.1 hypothetical protein [Amphritea atlantica]MDO6420794.1 hypothetical protein [Amphritea sp. 2_MG-2023]
MLKSSRFRLLRIILLLIVLFVVAMNTWLTDVRIQAWERPVWVVLYPINADGRTDTEAYIDALRVDHFTEIGAFLQREASRYHVEQNPLAEFYLAPELYAQPPEIEVGAGLLDRVFWSLHMRWWSWRHDSWQGLEPDVRIYLRYFSPQEDRPLSHSLGLQKGMIGLVNGFAGVDYRGMTNFVIAHELLHTFGASDKYDLETNEPIYPDGYADPQQKPLLPQTRAEVMSGRIKVSPSWLLMPQTLDNVIVGPKTAREIGWFPH